MRHKHDPDPPEGNLKPASKYDLKFIERDMKTFVRMPALLKWAETNFGEFVCAASIYSWNSVNYRITYDSTTTVEDSCDSAYLPGQQFFIDILLEDIRFVGENRGHFVDTGEITLVTAKRLSRRDGDFTFPLLKAKDIYLRSCISLRGDRVGTAFEGWDKDQDEFYHVFLPLQRCARQQRDIRIRNGVTNYLIDKGSHVCPAQLSMLPLTGKRVPMPNWLYRLFRDIRKLKYVLVDYEVYGGWHYAFATIVGFSDCATNPSCNQQVEPRETMEVSVDDFMFSMNYASPKIEQQKHSAEERRLLLGSRCLLYLHRNLPGCGLPHYSVRLWHPNSPDLEKFYKDREGRASLKEYPFEPTEPSLSQYYYDFISGATECSIREKIFQSRNAYQAIDFDLDGLRFESMETVKHSEKQHLMGLLDEIFSPKNVESNIITRTKQDDILDEVMETYGHAYPCDKKYWRDRKLPVLGHVLDPRWLIWMDSSVHNDERLRQIISAAKHQLTKEAEALSSGFRLRVNWESFFLALRDRPGRLTRNEIRMAVHEIVTERAKVFEELITVNGEELRDNDEAHHQASSEKGDFARRYQQVLSMIRNAPLVPNEFWPTLRRISNRNKTNVESILSETACTKLIDVD